MTSKLTSRMVCTHNPNKGDFEFGGVSVKGGFGKVRWNTVKQGDIWVNGLFPEDDCLTRNCNSSSISLQNSLDEHSEVDWISKEIAYQELICNDRSTNHWTDYNHGKTDFIKDEHDIDIISTLTAVAALLRDWCVLEADLSQPMVDKCVERSNSLENDFYDGWVWIDDDKDKRSKVVQTDMPLPNDLFEWSPSDVAWDDFIQERLKSQQMLYHAFFHPGCTSNEAGNWSRSLPDVAGESFDLQKHIDTDWCLKEGAKEAFLSCKLQFSRETSEVPGVCMKSPSQGATDEKEVDIIGQPFFDMGLQDQCTPHRCQHPVLSRYSFGRESDPFVSTKVEGMSPVASASSDLLDDYGIQGKGLTLTEANAGSNLLEFDVGVQPLQVANEYTFDCEHVISQKFEINNELENDGNAVSLLHEAMPFVLTYMCLQDLLTMEKVCKSFKDWIRSDVLLWQQLHVEPPLSKSLTDDVLLDLASRAKGELRCLDLVECTKVTEAAVEQVVYLNPRLTKLSLPGCTRISADSVVRMVEILSHQGHPGLFGLKQLRVRNIYGLTREHLAKLEDMVGSRSSYQRKPQYYHNGHHASFCDDDRPIDVEECPKCTNVRLVYDCTREKCQQKQGLKFQDCRACFLCTVRCEECGRCINDNDFEETFSLDLLCSCCWLRLPKCAACSRPGCGRHADHFIRTPERTFFCGDCYGTSSDARGPEFNVHV